MSTDNLTACTGVLVPGTSRRIGVCRSCPRWQLPPGHAGWRIPLIPAATKPVGRARALCVNKVQA